tara:strand:+ start:1773 stop:2276 length:504 start_codon:yes stop_codon:yes gene_type:complete
MKNRRGYCLACFIHEFPDEKTYRNYKTKEKAVTDFIKAEFPDIDWTLDKQVACGCSLRRPDACADIHSHVILIEVDENRHKGYSCENKRTMELSQDFAHRPMVLIRFNPDANETSPSCWAPDGNGICIVKRSMRKEWATRLENLKLAVIDALFNIPTRTITVNEICY